jgi:hypothetical protein
MVTVVQVAVVIGVVALVDIANPILWLAVAVGHRILVVLFIPLF